MIVPVTARARRIVRLIIPVALFAACALLLSGCDPYPKSIWPQTSLSPHSDVAVDIQTLFVWTVILAAIVGVIVEGLLLFAVLRFRRKPGQTVGPPVGRHGSTRLEITWTLLPVLVLVGIGIPTVSTIFTTAAAAPRDSVQVDVIAHQWWWEFRYPQYHIVTANELHLPVGRTATFSLTSSDVIHSFWIPGLDGKRDILPNHVNNIWFTPNTTGVFPGQCAEFCGPAHAFMYMNTFVQPAADFDAWVRDQQAPAAALASASAAVRQGETVFTQGACAGCHTIAGTGAAGTIGPNLSHIGGRVELSGLLMPNTPGNLARWIRNSADFKPGSYMPPQNLSTSDMAAVVAFLGSLK